MYLFRCLLVGLYLLSCSFVRLFACLLASLPARLRAFIVCLLSCYCTCLFAQDGDMRRKEAWAFSFSRVNSLHMNPVIGCYPGTSPSRGSRAVEPGLQRSGCNDPKAGIASFSSSRRPVILLSHQCFVLWVMQKARVVGRNSTSFRNCVLFVHLVSFPDGCLVSLRCRKMVLQCQNRSFAMTQHLASFLLLTQIYLLLRLLVENVSV